MITLIEDKAFRTKLGENGLKIAEMETILLLKTEELTLYIIELNKKIKKLEEEINNLKNK